MSKVVMICRLIGLMFLFQYLGFNGYSQEVEKVVFTHTDGFYATPFDLAISADGGNDSLFFTLDGSDPTSHSLKYSAPIPISNTTIVRAIKYYDVPDSTASYTATFFFNVKHDFPIVSIVIDPDSLWNDTTGIYALGLHASTEQPYFGANFHEDWERKCQFVLFDKEGVRQVKQDCGVKIFGAWSRASEQKSLSLHAREKYGKKSFHYKFFDNLDIDKFKSIVLRNSGGDWNQTMFRDGFHTTLLRPLKIDHQAFQPSVVYLNGQYWGIHNIREKVNKDFLESHYKANDSLYNILQADGEIIEGTNKGYNEIIDYITTRDLSNNTNYQWVADRIDVNNYIRYCIGEIYIGNGDWPGNNNKYFNTNSPFSKWKWILFDTDFGFAPWSEGQVYDNNLSNALVSNGPNWPNPAWSTLLLRKLMENRSFRNSFVNQMCDQINTTFKPKSVVALIDSFKLMYQNEILVHQQRWTGYSYGSSWYIDNMKSYAFNRGAIVMNQMNQQFSLGGTINVSVLCDKLQGEVLVNSVLVPNGYLSGTYFSSVPITVKAIPKPGYRFVKWSGTITSTAAEVEYKKGQNGIFQPVFELAEPDDERVAINEINFSSNPNLDSKDWLEIMNYGKTSVDLGNWRLKQESGLEDYIFPSPMILIPGDFVVVAKEIDNFKNIYLNIDNVLKGLPFGLSSITDKIFLYNSNDVAIDSVFYNSVNQFNTSLAKETGRTLELINPNFDNWSADVWGVSDYGGTPGVRNSIYSTTAIRNTNELNFKSEFICYPNPVVNAATIQFALSRSSDYSIELIDLNGFLVTELVRNGFAETGQTNDIKITNNQLQEIPNGIYLLKLHTSDAVETIQIIVRH